MKPKICLGTAQFGLSYGITNVNGQLLESDVHSILIDAMRDGVSFLDTAQSYGNAESILGRTLPSDNEFKLISKLPAQCKESFSPDDCSLWEQSFAQSCRQLGVHSLDSFLVHNAKDFRKQLGDLLNRPTRIWPLTSVLDCIAVFGGALPRIFNEVLCAAAIRV